jgi:hypothetical protein
VFDDVEAGNAAQGAVGPPSSSRTAASKPSDEAAVIFVTLATAIISSHPLPTREC